MAGYIECDTWLGFASPIHEDFVTAEEFGIVVLLTLLQHLIHETLRTRQSTIEIY